MNRLRKTVFWVMGILLLYSNAWAQNLPEYHFKMLPYPDSLVFNMFGYTLLEEVAPFPQNGDLAYPTSPPSNNIHVVKYFPDEGFTGTEEFVFEYRGNPGDGYFSWAVKYSRFIVEVLPSILEVKADHVVTGSAGGPVEIDVLANDNTTHGPMTVTAITNVRGGSVQMNPDNTLSFTPDAGYEGTGFFNYLVEDAAGSTELGQVSVQVVDEDEMTEVTEIWLATLNTKPLYVLLPGNDYGLSDGPQHGTLDFASPNRLIYTPPIDFEGQDTFIVSNMDYDRIYAIDVYDWPNDGLAVVDDVVFTMKNEGVSFNVNNNDYKENYLKSWTQPDHGYVNYLNYGEFSYIPDEDFRGYDAFTYTKQVAPQVWQTATVRIGVGDFEPLALEEYPLNTQKDQPIVINYNIPVEDFVFDILNEPDHGTLTYYEGFQTVTVGCDEVTGYNLIVYEPDAGYTGTDDFELDYCPADNDCQLVKVSVNVLDEIIDPDCPCVGADCVWKGDTNQDGVVDVRDLLPIGFHMGAEGNSRDFDAPEWIGLNAADWNSQQGNTGIDLKHVDSDGNGRVEAIDTQAIHTNYTNIHTIVPKGVSAFKPFPLYLTTEQDTVYEGDWLNLTISVGDAQNPVVDITGLTYTWQFPPELVDSSSLNHVFFEEGWFANASSTLQLDKQPAEGRLEAGFTRIGGIGTSGHGPIAKCDFIVEDDIEGLKLKDPLVPIVLRVTGGIVMDQYGNTFGLPDAEKTIYLDLRKKEDAPVSDELLVYPNPASGYVNVHLNGQQEFNRLQVYTSTGLLVDQYQMANTNRTRLNVDHLQSGVYIIVVNTEKGKTAQRFEVIK